MFVVLERTPRVASSQGSAHTIVEQLVWEAIAAGGRDNATAVVVDVVDVVGGERPPDRRVHPLKRFAA